MAPAVVRLTAIIGCGLISQAACLLDEGSEAADCTTGFLQSGLHLQVTVQREVKEVTPARAAVGLPLQNANCSGRPPADDLLPPLSFLAEERVLQEFGLAAWRERCPAPLDKASLVSLGIESHRIADVAQKNQWALWIALGWLALALSLIVWSFALVAIVPAKEKDRRLLKEPLADQERAYEVGVSRWIGLSWLDELQGRYGKSGHAKMDESELSWNRQSLRDFQPHLTIQKHWDAEVKEHGGDIEKVSLAKVIFKSLGAKTMLAMWFTAFMEEFLNGIGMVYALNKFLTTLENLEELQKASPGIHLSYLEPTIQCVILIWGVPFVYRIFSISVVLMDGHISNFATSGLASMVFQKALHLSAGSSAEKGGKETSQQETPNIVQVLNQDIMGVWTDLAQPMARLINAPLNIGILLVMLISEVKAAGFVGSLYVVPFVVIIFLVLQWRLSWYQRYQTATDRRIRWLQESLTHIRTVKALSWEKLAFERGAAGRVLELSCLRGAMLITGILTALGPTVPIGVLLCTMLYFLKVEGNIKAHQIIVVSRIIGSFLNAVAIILVGLQKFIEVPNSFNRIRRFMAQPDRPPNEVPRAILPSPLHALKISGSFTYTKEEAPVLRNLDIAVGRKELVAVVGGVASGKSSLLHAMLGELYPIGTATVDSPSPESGKIAFCAQVPWIFEGTLRENVVLDQAMDVDRYWRCIHAASLADDLKILPGGDEVTIGTHGIRLSGGQRARVALARAAFAPKAEIAILDDPFASVDVHTGRHIFEHFVLGELRKKWTQVIAMQPNPAFLTKFDRILVLEAGQVVQDGPAAKVLESEAFKKLQSKAQEETGPGAAGKEPKTDSPASAAKGGDDKVNLRDEEQHEEVSWQTVHTWISRAGYVKVGLFFFLTFGSKIMEISQTLIIGSWINAKVADPNANDGFFMWLLTLSCAFCAFLAFSVTAQATNASNTASASIYLDTLGALLRAPIDLFFDKQPVGRLINRLTGDVGTIDVQVPGILTSMFCTAAYIIVAQLWSFTVIPWPLILAAMPFYCIMGYFVSLYANTAISLVTYSKHILSNLQDIQAMAMGTAVSIRANNMVENFVARYHRQVHSAVRTRTLVNAMSRAWAQSRIFLTFGTLTCLFAIGGMWTGMPLGTLAAIITLSFTQMVEFDNVSFGITTLIFVMNSVQRILSYSDVPQEAPLDMDEDPVIKRQVRVDRSHLGQLAQKDGGIHSDGVPLLRRGPGGRGLRLEPGRILLDLAPKSAQLKGLEGFDIVAVNGATKSIEAMMKELCEPPNTLDLVLWSSADVNGMGVNISNLVAGYGNAKPVLHGISVDIVPRSRCGFAGKTGCGKSTILLCLLRILEPRQGIIRIGGRDSAKMGLSALRKIVGLVPQDPTMFQGTWRFNVDPFDEFSDARVWQALNCVQLMSHVRNLPAGIHSQVGRDGSNMSFGQRQLLSLARMVIRQPPVLLLDECTSALDPQSQAAAQKSLESDFPLTTTIAIAHRLETIKDYDQIVVLEEGKVIENGPPKELAAIKGGAFAQMLQAAKHS